VTETRAPVAWDRFSGLDQLRAAHDNLLRRDTFAKDSPAFWGEVKGFIARACATGVILDADADRSAAQGLITYWVNVLCRTNREIPGETTLAEFDETWCPDLDESLQPYLAPGEARKRQPRLLFGWQRLVQECVHKLEDNGLLAVVGAAGSGRGWLATAGVLPALKDGALPGSAAWRVLPTVTPDVKPLEDLARALAPGGDPAEEAQRLRQDPEHLGRRLDADGPRPAVLVIDRFERLFTLGARDEAQPFIAALVALAAGARHRVILTVRSDYLGHVSAVESLAPVFERGKVFIAFTGRELRQAIEEPAKEVGLRFEPGLVERLLLDVQGDPAAATLLQFTLWQLWEARKGNRITREVYERLGAGRTALERAAERVYQQLEKQGNGEAARRVWTAIVQPEVGGGARASSARRGELHPVDEPPDRVASALGAFVAARLVSCTPGPTPAEDRFAPTHEALIGHWLRLDEWLAEEREQRRRWLRLRAAAEQWRASGEDRVLLWGGLALAEAIDYPDLEELQRRFLDASQQEEQRQAALRTARLWLAVAALVIIAVLTIAVLHTQKKRAEELAREADLGLSLMDVSIGERFENDLDYSSAALWYANALELVYKHKKKLPPGVWKSFDENYRLRLAMTWHRLPGVQCLLHHDKMVNAAFSRTGRWAVTMANASEQDGEETLGSRVVRLWDLSDFRSSEWPKKLLNETPVNDVCFSPDGKYLFTAGGSLEKKGRAQVWCLGPSLRKGYGWELPSPGKVTQVECSPDGSRLVVVLLKKGNKDNNNKPISKVFVWGIDEQGEPEKDGQGKPRKADTLATLSADIGVINRAAFRPPAGDRLVLGTQVSEDKGKVVVWDLLTGKTSEAKHRDEAPILYVCYGAQRHAQGRSPRRLFITCGGRERAREGEAVIWDGEADTPRLSARLRHQGAVVHAVFNSEMTAALTSGQDGTARLWTVDGEGRATPERTYHHDADVAWADLSPDGRYVVTGCRDRVARVWDKSTGKLAFPPLHHGGTVGLVQFSADGSRVFSVNAGFSEEDKKEVTTAHVWRLDGDDHAAQYIPLPGAGQHMEFDRAGERFILVARQGWGRSETRVWGTDGRSVSPALVANERVKFAALSADGHRAVTLSGSEAYLWDPLKGEVLGIPLRHGATVHYACFSPKGDFLITVAGDEATGKGEATLWKATDGQRHKDLPHEWVARFAVFTRDGARVLTTGGTLLTAEKGAAQLWRVRDGRQVLPFKKVHEEPITHAAFNADERLVVTASTDNKACVWDAGTGEPLKAAGGKLLLLEKHTADVVRATFHPTGRYLVTAGMDSNAILWDLKTGRDLTHLRHNGSVTDAVFSPDGRYIVTISRDRTACVWDMLACQTGVNDEQVRPPQRIAVLRHPGEVVSAVFDGNTTLHTLSYEESGPTAVLGGRAAPPARRGPVRLLSRLPSYSRLTAPDPRFRVWRKTWNLAPDNRRITTIVKQAQFLAKRTIQEKSRSVEVDPVEQLVGKWKEEQQSYQDEPVAYHEHEADKAEAAGLWRVALWHLDWLLARDNSADRKARWLARRARLHGRLGQWQDATRDSMQAINAIARGEIRSRLAGDLLPRLHVRLAQAYARDDKTLAQALREYDAAVLLNGNDPRVWIGKAEVHVRLSETLREKEKERQSELEKAAECCDFAINAGKKTDTEDIELRAFRSGVLGEDGLKTRWEDVIEDCSVALDGRPAHPENWKLYSRRASALKTLGGKENGSNALKDYLEAARRCSDPSLRNVAIGFYSTALTLVDKSSPSHDEILKGRGQLYARSPLPLWDLAVGDLKKVKDRDWRLQRLLAQSYGHQGEAVKAAQAFDEAIKKAPEADKVDLWRDKAGMHRQNRQWQEAVEAYSNALQLAKKDSSLLEDRASAYESGRQWDKAIADYSEGIQFEKERKAGVSRLLMLYAKRSRAHEKAGKMDEAIEDAGQSITLQPNSGWFLEKRARLYEQVGRWKDSVADYTKAITLQPQSTWLLDNRARARAELACSGQGEWADLETDLRSLVKLAPWTPVYLHRLTVVQTLRGDSARLGDTIDKLLDRARQTTTSAASSANTIAGSLILAGNEKAHAAQAIELAQRAVKAMPSSPTYLNTLGAAYYRHGDYKTALDFLNQSREQFKKAQRAQHKKAIEDGKVEDWLFLAMTHHQLDQHPQAKAWLDKAQKWLEADEKKKGTPTDPASTVWQRIERRLLLRQAETLFKPRAGGRLPPHGRHPPL
jgi:WD40 repeat protein/tetratricopeptide (TPR) repeat protein